MLHQTLLTELGEQLGVSTERDVEAIRHRVEHEGLSFLTITLPEIDSLLLKGIEDGTFPANDCQAFALNRQRSLPLFLGGFFRMVFNEDGSLKEDVLPDAIFAIRQIARLFKKLKLPCSGKRNLDAIRSYLNIEKELRNVNTTVRSEAPNVIDHVSCILWSNAFGELSPDRLIARHGPGKTADGLRANARWSIQSWYARFEASFPPDLHAIPNYGWHEHLGRIPFIALKDEHPVKVVFVPKTLKSPRVIAMEPSVVQYVQQALMAYTVRVLESHPLTRNSVRFSDQTVNQARARSASQNRRLATMDMSEASDRVSLGLVQRIFARSPILPFLEDSRSLSATLPSGQNIVLEKFASMGSAMCFPVEAMVFYTLIQACLHQLHGRRPSSRSVREYSKLIDIYGDDIIVPTSYVDDVIRYLESYGLKVNRAKTFSRSLFRESCGGDFYNGYSVKPVYAAEVIPSTYHEWNATNTMSWLSKANQFYELGLWKTTSLLRSWIDSRWGRVPLSVNDGEGLFYKSVFQRTQCRYNGLLHRYEQRRVVFTPKKVSDDISNDGLASLFRCLAHKRDDDSHRSVFDIEDNQVDLVSSTKRGVFTPKRRWVTTQ
jgi:hypothetical protein